MKGEIRCKSKSRLCSPEIMLTATPQPLNFLKRPSVEDSDRRHKTLLFRALPPTCLGEAWERERSRQSRPSRAVVAPHGESQALANQSQSEHETHFSAKTLNFQFWRRDRKTTTVSFTMEKNNSKKRQRRFDTEMSKFTPPIRPSLALKVCMSAKQHKLETERQNCCVCCCCWNKRGCWWKNISWWRSEVL